MLGHRKNEWASCRLTKPRFAKIDGLVELTKMRSAKRGYGSKLLQSVCQEADKLGKSLIVHVESTDGEKSEADLISWYAKHGFEQIQDSPPLMARCAKVTDQTVIKSKT